MILCILSSVNYGFVLIFGILLSAEISGGCETTRQKWVIALACPVFLALQIPLRVTFGLDLVEKIYPVLVHLPLILLLIFALGRSPGVALVSVYTAYLCCELPNWVRMVITEATHSQLAGQICYTLLIIPLFFILRRYFVRAAHEAMTCSKTALWLFGALPVSYYFFDYATTIYSNALYSNDAISESLPAVLVTFYVVFLTAYHAQAERGRQAELQSSMLAVKWSQAQTQMETLRRAQTQTAVYQHDMRHHLTMLEGLITAGKPEQASQYIRKVQSDIETITPRRYCENELVNLLCSSFAEKAQHAGARLDVDAKLPRELGISDAELCAVLSNALENALHAVAALEEAQRTLSLYCAIRLGKLLIEVKNPYAGELTISPDGSPVTARKGARLRLPEHPDHRRPHRRSLRVQSSKWHLLPPDRPAPQKRRRARLILYGMKRPPNHSREVVFIQPFIRFRFRHPARGAAAGALQTKRLVWHIGFAWRAGQQNRPRAYRY